ncbi:MAG: DNA polymerase III subunit alpha, partial [Deltaproteobacteria bacterium]|nr:DNA polymerase III subunit alpha [Deltaproteobacteria bacterium]
DTIPLDDALVYRKLADGDTQGIFQLESQGMTALVSKLKPTVFSDIVALVALFRPGPLGSGMVDDFINRKHGRIAIQYELPQLESILRDTYGVIVYQEQVMRIASELAGFSLGDADILRRAMGKKQREEMALQREQFLKGAATKKIPPKKAEHIFDLMAKFAEYGFNKSHSAAYALVAYQTAYLKCHHPTEYLAALITSEHLNADKVLDAIADAKNHGITVLPPDVNESDSDFSVVGDNVIRFGLGGVKNVGEAAIESILEVRKNGSFSSLVDFCERVDSRKVNKRVIESLIKCGAFDSLREPRARLMAALDQVMEIASATQRDRLVGQSRLFDLVAGARDAKGLPTSAIDVPEWPDRQLLSFEKEALGFYITGHPLAQFDHLLKTYATVDTVSLAEVRDRQEVRFGGVVTKMREVTTRRGDRMGFATIEDLKGMVEVVVFSDVYTKEVMNLKGERPLFVVGLADTDGEKVKVIAQQILLLEDVPLHLTKSVHFVLHSPELTQHHLEQLKSVLTRYPGNCPGFVHLVVPEKTETVLELPQTLRLEPSPQLVGAVQKLFGHNVTHFSTT